jgi:hypothetical protein
MQSELKSQNGNFEFEVDREGRESALLKMEDGMETLERNKANVIAFYELMFNDCKPREAIERYAGDDYIQHNPHVATGKAGFIDYRWSGRASG